MLNIPESVKTLFKTDGTHKNFRAHFPNGEFPDITNENIVRESLTITESICSRDVFKFGLAEASVLEVETVGIGNMYGMTIQASIEIDLSSLTAEEIANIEAGTWDGEYVALADSDLGFPFFRVPLGVFRVEKCPRNHGAMTHRQVTAYGANVALNDYLSPFEQWKLENAWTYKRFSFNSVDSLVWSNIGWAYPEIVNNLFQKTEVATGYDTDSTSLSIPNIYLDDGTVITFNAYHTDRIRRITASSTEDALFAVDATGFSVDNVFSWIKNQLEGIEHGELFEDVKDAFLNRSGAWGAIFHVAGSSTGTANYYYWSGYSPIACVPKNDSGVTYSVAAPLTFQVLFGYRLGRDGENVSVRSPVFQTSESGVPFKLYSLAYNATPLAVGMAIASTGGTKDAWTFVDAYSLDKILPDWLELSGVFGRSNRGAGFEIVSLSPSAPEQIEPGDYEDAWWDEYDVEPIGKVLVNYKADSSQEDTASVTIGGGASVYDMTGNETLKSLEIASLAEIENILSGDFANNAANVGFTPIEMSMQGWPWLEAGDALQITVEDGTIVNTYALRVEMSGVQHLMSTITAEGGEIVGET